MRGVVKWSQPATRCDVPSGATSEIMAPSSIEKDETLSRSKERFDSARGYQIHMALSSIGKDGRFSICKAGFNSPERHQTLSERRTLP